MLKTESNDASPIFANPFGDLTKAFAQFKMPAVDMSTLIEARRKEVEALVAANQETYEAMQALARTQSEMLTRAMQAMQETGNALLASGSKGAEHIPEEASKAWSKMLADMMGLAESARKAQAEAVASMTQGTARFMQVSKQAMLSK